ncbi:hypothetical protein [Empedobacter falsenii]|uniref:Uncharacterized protein n=1 Tax=Empedobacter falsenii TaxID=343874 RepID=A0AAW7DFM4_9FLAO|nr:hypothetical protein [Empedobacter falsenii]MDM1549797.1 hypothetical protein [Empedobacter falsenii]
MGKHFSSIYIQLKIKKLINRDSILKNTLIFIRYFLGLLKSFYRIGESITSIILSIAVTANFTKYNGLFTFISDLIKKDRFSIKRNKKAAKFERTPAQQPAKSLRHNETEKTKIKLFFLFHPLGLNPFPFVSALSFPIYCFLFLLFLLKTKSK